MARSRLGLIALASGLLTVTSMGATTETSDDVRRRLAAGEVVVTPALPPGASKTARGGTALAMMRASPEQVWRVIVDYRGHPRYYPRVTAAEVVDSDERHVLVRYQVTVSPFSFGFYMDKYPDPGRRRVEWHLADGHSHGLFRENSTMRTPPTRASSRTPSPCARCCRASLPAAVSTPASPRP
jgi:Polyketide cyclase / dehydrase and lipid transport